MNFGSVLKQLRQEYHLTQKQLAEVLGLSESTIGMYERGQREPDFETAEAIADYFNVDMDYLYGRTEIKRKISYTPDGEVRVTEDGVVIEPYEKWADKDARLLRWFRSLPPEKQRAILYAQDAPEDLV